ncbi:hypothetical protein SISSUDRAFT_1123633 [Sistotremastrum suecicum HHB10207 ss-3]|uniref:Uncharacterized protein n=1 Tax=Sistotremastrum suecicum HHB10207 ss-3 TaxID=1314776 RepID=A0A165X983_9AGAM|nr:hypothetical protein SISSUDRAFT_1123633 [Sistotremastrum suecicum HHB10207 ss-3]
MRTLGRHVEHHDALSSLIGLLLARRWEDPLHLVEDLYFDIASAYIPMLDQALEPIASKFKSKGIPFQEWGCSCDSCNANLLYMVWENVAETADPEDSRVQAENHFLERLPSALLGRASLFRLLEELTPTNRAALEDQLLSKELDWLKDAFADDEESVSITSQASSAASPVASSSRHLPHSPPPTRSSNVITSEVGVQTSPVIPEPCTHGFIATSSSSTIQSAAAVIGRLDLSRKRRLSEITEENVEGEQEVLEVKRARRAESPSPSSSNEAPSDQDEEVDRSANGLPTLPHDASFLKDSASSKEKGEGNGKAAEERVDEGQERSRTSRGSASTTTQHSSQLVDTPSGQVLPRRDPPRASIHRPDRPVVAAEAAAASESTSTPSAVPVVPPRPLKTTNKSAKPPSKIGRPVSASGSSTSGIPTRSTPVTNVAADQNTTAVKPRSQPAGADANPGASSGESSTAGQAGVGGEGAANAPKSLLPTKTATARPQTRARTSGAAIRGGAPRVATRAQARANGGGT